jgi:hypothetical protein
MQIKLYQATICYRNYNVQTTLCESLEILNQLLAHHSNYVCYERAEITIEIDESGQIKQPFGIKYKVIDRNS